MILKFNMAERQKSDEKIKTYKISANYKKSTYEEEHWINTINNKRVDLHVTCYYRWGTFTINLTNSQKDKILKEKSIVLNDYDFELNEMWDGDCRYVEIQNEDTYSEEEIKNINKTLYEDEDEVFDDDFMESNGWYIDKTIYGISCECMLENDD